MMTLVLSSSPAKLRGHLTRWLMEVSPGVYVGRVSARVRDELWELVKESLSSGKAVLSYPSNRTEQGFVVEVFRGPWELVDLEGLFVMRRPIAASSGAMKAGWSKASRSRQRARKASKSK